MGDKVKMTISDFKKFKEEGRKFSYVTAYDYTTASIVDDSDVEIILVGDSLGMLRQAVALKKPGEWVSMMGYEPSFFPEKRHPTIEELDEIAPDNPVHCMHEYYGKSGSFQRQRSRHL